MESQLLDERDCRSEIKEKPSALSLMRCSVEPRATINDCSCCHTSLLSPHCSSWSMRQAISPIRKVVSWYHCLASCYIYKLLKNSSPPTNHLLRAFSGSRSMVASPPSSSISVSSSRFGLLAAGTKTGCRAHSIAQTALTCAGCQLLSQGHRRSLTSSSSQRVISALRTAL
jgi:hypothetical protein